MKSSMVSSPRNSGVLEVDEEASPEESTWTEYLADYDARREEEMMSNTLTCSMTMSSASMVSDAGSGPHWKLRSYDNNNNVTTTTMNNSMPRRLNLKRAKETPYDSLEDTASSPVNSPKITTGFKRMEINCRRPADDTFDTYHGKGRALDARQDEYQVLKAANSINGGGGGGEPGKELAEKGFCLVPYTTLMNLSYYHLPRF